MTYQIPRDLATSYDTTALQGRLLRHRERRRSAKPASVSFKHYLDDIIRRRKPLPARIALHVLVVLLVPLAALAGPWLQTLPAAPQPQSAPAPAAPSDFVAPVAPLSLDRAHDAPVGDAAFAEIDALATPSFNPDQLVVRPAAATIAVEVARLRGGPGTNYDELGRLTTGTPLQVLARHNDWFKAQLQDGRIVWLAAELLTLDRAAVDALPDATDIPAPPPPRIGTVAEDNLNLRDGPGTNYIGMGKLNAGTSLDLLARYGEWLQVQTGDGRTGWVSSQHVSLVPGVFERVEAVSSIPNPDPALVGSVSERSVTLRGGPGTNYDKLGLLNGGAQLDLLARYEDWYKVRTPNGSIGWVSMELVDVGAFIARRVQTTRNIPAPPRRTTAPAQPAAQPAARAQAAPQPAAQPAAPPKAVVQPQPAPAPSASNAVDLATQFVGAPYVWGGESPRGFDCSGFTRYVYKQFGLNLPHSAAGQYNTVHGAVVSNPADLQPGDLVFFANTYKRGISHVGIYIGGGNVVQALTPKLGVGVANMSGGYWSSHYYGAIRPRV